MSAELTDPEVMTAALGIKSAQIDYLVSAHDHAFDLAAALAELVLMVAEVQRTKAHQFPTPAADVCLSDSRLALQAFQEWVEAAP